MFAINDKHLKCEIETCVYSTLGNSTGWSINDKHLKCEIETIFSTFTKDD